MNLPITVFCQYNPLSASTSGGIGTLIRSYIASAPEDFHFSIVGVSDDANAMPALSWKHLQIGARTVPFLPLFIEDGRKRSVPLSLRFTNSLFHHRHLLKCEGHVLHFHRPEPAIPLLSQNQPKFVFIHNTVGELRATRAEQVKGVLAAGANRWIEDAVLTRVDRVWAVREAIAQNYRLRFPALADKFEFTPTWVDTDKFKPLSSETRETLRKELALKNGWLPSDQILMFLGRLEAQKDPLLAIEVLKVLKTSRNNVRLCMIGEGSLRPQIEEAIRSNGLLDSVAILGNLEHHKVVTFLGLGDALLLTSRYEGMPVAVLESLASGVPVIATDVGEVNHILNRGGGELVNSFDASVLAIAVSKVWDERPSIYECLHAVKPFMASCVLAKIYDAHYQFKRPYNR
jgi:glycosyltransferase involved in cell wall biosynthesis